MKRSHVMVAALLGLSIAGRTGAQALLGFSSATYSADEDCQWMGLLDGALPGNAFYIGGLVAPGERDAWLDALHAYRREIRTNVRGLRQVEFAYQGVRAWCRMRAAFAKALDLGPSERFRIELGARWVEGNSELVLALDLHSRPSTALRMAPRPSARATLSLPKGRRDDSKLGWSTAFSTLDVPRDGEWHQLTWEGVLPEFDHETTWVKLIFGMDATHDATPGRVLVRDFSLEIPERAETGVRELLAEEASPALDRTIYERTDLQWASRAFVCHFTFMYDLSFYDPVAGQYTLDEFLEQGEREFGGYDALVLWHAYPRIGVDERNQFDFYRDMPGGLEALRDLVRRLHQRGIRVFIAYNPWDRGTRREPVSDEEALAAMVAALEADGIFLDTMSAGGPELRAAIDRARPGVVFEPEGSPSIEQLEICSASWAQGLPELPEPGLLRLKWIEPRHMQHQINRWSGSHQRELEAAFFNGSGMLVWENVFGTWNPWRAADRATLRRAAPILRLFAGQFASDAWEPMVPTLVPGVYANAWPFDYAPFGSPQGRQGGPGEKATVWTILNRTGQEVNAPLLRIPMREGLRFFDLWSSQELRPRVAGNEAEISARLGPIGCIAAISDERRLAQVEELIARQRAEAERALPEADPRAAAASVIEPRPVEPSPTAPADQPPEGMALVPAGTVTMDLIHQRRECGCYPDPGTPPERWRDLLWGAPFNGTIEHHIGPIEVAAFFIDEHEVTNAEYARFLRETGYRPEDRTNFLKHWGGDGPLAELADHPVVYVDLDDARAYTRWAGKRLATELEWHRAAQGDDGSRGRRGRTWPWGDEFDPARCNGEGEGTTPVTAYPDGRSPFGCYDMAGNVWEWTESERSDGHTRFCIIRGGSYFRAEGSVWYVEGGPQPCTSHTKFILMYPGLDRCSTIGFRCVKDVAPAS